MIEPYKKKTLIAVKKAASLSKKILEMIESEEYCMDIIQQIKAANGLLSSAFELTLENHMQTCGKHAFASSKKSEQEKMIKEIMLAFKAAKR